MYYRGEGVKQSKEKAFELIFRSAKLGLVNAQYDLAFMYKEGDWVNKDDKKVIYWFKSASKLLKEAKGELKIYCDQGFTDACD